MRRTGGSRGGRADGGRQGRAEGHCEFGGSRFPRDVGRKVPAGPVLSPRQDDQPAVSNIKPTCTGSLSSTRYPNLPTSSLPPPPISSSPAAPYTATLTGRPNLPHTYRTSPHRRRGLPSKPTPSARYVFSISPICRRAYVVCPHNARTFVA